MRARDFGLGIIAGLLLAFSSAFRPVSPSLDTQSVFFKSYNPEQVIQRFACGNIIEGGDSGSSDSAGVGYADNKRFITTHIEIDEDHWVPLMRALVADVDKQLLLRGSLGGPGKDTMTRLYYQDGRSLGTVTIPPLVPYDFGQDFRRQPGCTPVSVKVFIDEIFVPKLPLDPTDQAARISNRWDRNQHERDPVK